MNKKDSLIEALTDTLPVISSSINNILISLPRDIENFDSNKFDSVRPEVKSLIQQLKVSIDNIPITEELFENEQTEDIYNDYIDALSVIIDGIQSLYDFMNEDKEAHEDSIEFFVDSLYSGSIQIMKLVEELVD